MAPQTQLYGEEIARGGEQMDWFGSLAVPSARPAFVLLSPSIEPSLSGACVWGETAMSSYFKMGTVVIDGSGCNYLS